KHGNRSVSSMSGSADVLEALGVKIDLNPEKVEKCLEATGFGFMFAPLFHPAMKYAIGPRREMGIRTIFNILGPLTNPAGAQRQVLGVFKDTLTEPLAEVLENLGTKHAFIVHGEDGLDEITNTDKTKISELKDGRIDTYFITPEDLGFARAKKEDLLGGTPGNLGQGEFLPRGKRLVDGHGAGPLRTDHPGAILHQRIDEAAEILFGYGLWHRFSRRGESCIRPSIRRSQGSPLRIIL
ncbi:MAG: anthranilate phosphoribosyltransferase, partial [Geobacter sp.]|nr:anthranilate phosphoribosyltransferase [Geobacter sp.]